MSGPRGHVWPVAVALALCAVYALLLWAWFELTACWVAR
jgi:hypothetical protein